MKSLILFLLLCVTCNYAQNNLLVKLDGNEWRPDTVYAGVQKVMDLSIFGIIGQKEKGRLDISMDYEVIKGKESASFIFTENMMMPPGGASLSYAPKGLGKQQWITSGGSINLTKFNETANTASGNFEATLVQILDDNGGFVMSTPRPSMKISGSFENVKFTKVN